jgi:hypothetical protein
MVRLRRVAFTVVAALGLAPAGFSANNSHVAEYLGGTVKAVDEKTTGTLDLSDPTTLKFRYGGLVYQLPYANIRSFQFSTPKPEHKKIAHVPVPKLPFRGGHIQVVAISFKEEGGSLGTASFKLNDASRASLESELDAKVDNERKTAVANGGKTKQPDAWWGDKNWKTLRNKGTWPDPSTENTTAAAGTK